MTPTFLVDTDVLSEPMRPRPHSGVLECLRAHHGLLATASVVLHELRYGCCRLPASDRRRSLEDYLNRVVESSMTILPYDTRAALWHASERARLAAQGLNPPYADGQIAAIAAVNDLILVTHNTSDYARFKGLRVEDWHR